MCVCSACRQLVTLLVLGWRWCLESDVPLGHSDYVTKALLVQHQRQLTTSPPKAEFIYCKLPLALEEYGFPVNDCLCLGFILPTHSMSYLFTYMKWSKYSFNYWWLVLKLKELLKGNVIMTTRKRLLNCYMFSVLKYGCESWTVNKNLMKRINAFERWCYRRMLKISWKDKVPNTEVLKRVGEKEQQLFRKIVQQKLAYAGHVLRVEEMHW